MAKRKTLQPQKQLSPEKYIKTRARTLPIYECLISSEWETESLLNIFVAREHSNGNVSVCFYLVDIYCLGVKESFFYFNISKSDYEDLIHYSDDPEDQVKTVDYTTVHNILFAALEFADDYGFKPCKLYDTVTKYFLAEDDDSIELMDIVCGRNDKPVYIQSEMESHVEATRIIDTLEKTAGQGGYEYFNLLDEEEEKYFDDLISSSVEDRLKAIYDNVNHPDFGSEDSMKQLTDTVFSLSDDFVDADEVQEYADDLTVWYKSFSINTHIPAIYFGDADPKLKSKVESIFKKCIASLDDALKRKSYTDNIKKLIPDSPLSDYVDLLNVDEPAGENKIEYAALVDRCIAKHPNILLFHLDKVKNDSISNNDSQHVSSFIHSIGKNNDGGENVLWDFEFAAILELLIFEASIESSVTKLLGLEKFCENIAYLSEDLELVLFSSKVTSFVNYYEECYVNS